MKKKKLLKSVVAICIIMQAGASVVKADEFNQNTNWMNDALYGITDWQMPNCPSNGNGYTYTSKGYEIVPNTTLTIEEWHKEMENYDVDKLAEMAAEAGVGYLQLAPYHVTGYIVAPNKIFEETFGSERAGKRDLIEDLYQALKKYDIKLGLYMPSEPPWGFEELVGKEANKETPESLAFWSSVIEEWSLKYGDKISYWWFDGAYEHTGFNSPEILEERRKAALAGNPNAVVCFNAGASAEQSWDPRWGVADFIAGENYGITPVPESRWYRNIQWHRYMPFVDYCSWGCGYSFNDIIDYMQKVKDGGGVITFAGAELYRDGEMVFDPIHMEVLKEVKRVIRDGEEKRNGFDGSKKIDAVYASHLTDIGVYQPNRMYSTHLTSEGTGLGEIKFETAISNSYINPDYAWRPFTTESLPDGEFNIWASYENVTIPENIKNIAISVREPYNKEAADGFENRLEIRLGDRYGHTLATIENVGGVDWFWFTEEPVEEDVPDGYRLENMPIEVCSGASDIYLVDVLLDDPKKAESVSAYDGIESMGSLGRYVSGAVLQGELSGRAGDCIGSMDDGDTIKFSNIDFGEATSNEMLLTYGMHNDFAGKKLEIYKDSVTEENMLATYIVEGTGNEWGVFKTVSIEIEEITGVHDIVFRGVGGAGVADLKSFKFTSPDVIRDYSEEAVMLNELGLFHGVSNETFEPDLDAEMNREMGVVMLMHLTAMEDDVKALDSKEVDEILSVYKDKDEISNWAKPYVAYAYKNKIVAGVETDKFGAKQQLTGKAYSAMILRNIGYTVSGDDYEAAAFMLADKGGITLEEANLMNDHNLTRNEMVGISYYSLFVETSDGKVTLMDEIEKKRKEKIISDGNYTHAENVRAAVDYDKKSEPTPVIDSESKLVGNYDNGTWLAYNNINFDGEERRIVLEAAVHPDYANQQIEVRLDSPTGMIIATVNMRNTGGWLEMKEHSGDVENVTGLHDVYLVGKGSYGICTLKSFWFE